MAQGQEQLRQATSSAQQMSGGRGVKLEKMAAKLAKELVDEAAKIRQKRNAEITHRRVWILVLLFRRSRDEARREGEQEQGRDKARGGHG